MRDLRPGDIVYGHTNHDTFEIVAYIDSGAFGDVYEVKDRNGRKFALKTIHTPSLDETKFRALVNEGHLATRINHPNAVRALFFHDGEKYDQFPPYVIMEYADGGTLRAFLDRRLAIGDQFNSQELREIMLQLAYGMKAVNEQLVHRDIHPGNILVAGDHLKIADFGVSKVVGVATRSQTFKGQQHWGYRSPESWSMEENSLSMDIYSMGVTFYEIATLRNPYEAEVNAGTREEAEAWRYAHLYATPQDPRTPNPQVDLVLGQLILKMISKRREDRYSSWDEIITRLQSDAGQSESKRDVTPLVEMAVQRQRQKEQDRLKREELAAQAREHDNLVMFSFGEVRKAANETVDAFNQQSEGIKLRIHDVAIETLGPGFIIHTVGPGSRSGEIKVAIVGVFDEHRLQGQRVQAWGYVKAPSGRGFNLVLVLDAPENVYGKWITIQATHNPMLGDHSRDRRPTPFPFEIHELPHQIRSLNTIGVFQREQGEFNVEMFDPLILELLSNGEVGEDTS